MRYLAVLLLLAAGGAAALEPRPFPIELRLDGAREKLAGNFADWREAAVQLSWRPGSRESAFVGFRSIDRFGQRDGEASAGGYIPVPRSATMIHLEGSWSETHRVLPRSMALVEIVQPLRDGWVLSAGGKASRYASADIRSAWIGTEKYFGDFRLAYQALVSRPHGAAWAPSHRVAAGWYSGDLAFIAVNAARGREAENIFPAGVLLTDVRAVSAAAGVGITRQWGLLFELGWTRQGDLYTRRTARIGTRVLF